MYGHALHRLVVVLAVGAVVAVLGLSLPSCSSHHENWSDLTGGDVDALAALLQADGFHVQGNEPLPQRQTDLQTLDVIRLCSEGYLSSCYGNNAGFPYMTTMLAHLEGQAVFGDEVVLGGKAVNYRLRPDEALVLIGTTPPPCAYFSYRSYVFGMVTSSGARERVFASLGDSINHMTINTSGTPDGAPGSPFGQKTVIISAADREVERRVRAALAQAGFSPAVTNTDVIAPSLVRMGWEEPASTFAFLNRFALWENEEEGKAYLASRPFQVLRLTPETPPAALDPFPVPALRKRGTGHTEFDLRPGLELLRQAILARFGGYHAVELATTNWTPEPEGLQCIDAGVECLGDMRDTVYLRAEDVTLADDPEDFLIVYGVSHERSGKATYSAMSLYGTVLMNGVTGRNSRQLLGSARPYVTGNPQWGQLDPDLYYVATVRRGDPATEDTNTLATFRATPKAYGIPVGEPLFLAFRAYCEPATKVGPLHSELLYDRVIHFTRP